MLIGEYQRNLDEKNRLVMPSKLIRELGDEVIVKALGKDKKGRQNFSRKEALPPKKETKKKKEEK